MSRPIQQTTVAIVFYISKFILPLLTACDQGRYMKNQITKFIKPDTDKILNDQFLGLIEGLTGLAGSKKEKIFLSIGKVLQKIRSAQFLSTLQQEWSYFREKGKVKDDYQFTDQHITCLQEMLDFLDSDAPDDVRFSVMKSIFIVAATEEKSTRESVLPQQYMKLCRQLNSGEILVLKATFDLVKKKHYTNPRPKQEDIRIWLKPVAESSGLKHRELVEIYEKTLMSKNMLAPRHSASANQVTLTTRFRLTDLGFGICEFISNYKHIEKK